MQFKLGCSVQDFLAHVESTGVKGVSGHVMCLFCRNMTGWPDLKPGSYCKHFKTARPSEFDLHTVETLNDTVETVKACHLAWKNGITTKAKFEDTEIALGVKYTPDGIMFDEDTCFQATEHVYVDAMHTYLASGGVAQVEINEFCLEAESHGLTLSPSSPHRPIPPIRSFMEMKVHMCQCANDRSI